MGVHTLHGGGTSMGSGANRLVVDGPEADGVCSGCMICLLDQEEVVY